MSEVLKQVGRGAHLQSLRLNEGLLGLLFVGMRCVLLRVEKKSLDLSLIIKEKVVVGS